jgi:acyl-CoA thioesterase
MTEFDEATGVHPIADGRYGATLDGAYAFGGNINGGYLIATALRAALAESPHAHPVATNATFLAPARPGPVEILIAPVKAGRTAAVSRLTVRQGDRAVVEAMVTSGTLRDDAVADWSRRPPVGLPPVAECRAFEPEANTFTQRVEIVYDPATIGWLDGTPTGAPEMRAHLRIRDGHVPDAYVLALAVDALPPVVLNTGGVGWAPTVELSWYMRAVPAPGWLAVHSRGRLVSDGWFDEESEVWDGTGRLVAQSRQIARLGRGAEPLLP